MIRGVLACTALAAADLPVHCLKHEIAGKWRVSLSPRQDHPSHCGHARPDREDAQPALSFVSDMGPSTGFDIELHVDSDRAATAKDGAGWWSVVYDEGWEARVEGLSLFGFSGFDLEVQADGSKKNQSKCHETQVGWYETTPAADGKQQFGCWHGSNAAPETTERAVLLGVGAESHRWSAAQRGAAEQRGHEREALRARVPDHAELAEHINSLSLGWRATGASKFAGMSLAHMNKRAGVKRGESRAEVAARLASRRVVAGETSQSRIHRKLRGALLQRDAQVASSAASRHTGETLFGGIPSTFDWRDKDGADYTEPVMDQGACGSCYVVSSVRMLTARHKVKTGDVDAEPFSIRYPLECSEFNQGCKGGYGVLTARWSSVFGLVKASCGRYSDAEPTHCSFHEATDNVALLQMQTVGDVNVKSASDACRRSTNGKKYRATGHRYVGANGSYGQTTEEALMREVIEHGPVVVGLEPKPDLMMYDSGIYKSPSGDADLTHNDPAVGEWERVDHAVLLLGWGTAEDGTDFWLLQNSWGMDWGEEGYFRMIRGINESGIESIGEAGDVMVDERERVFQ